ncbi:MAG: glycosyltransferase family 39 protein [Planctomycetes bacterium]|nr:glycosyltransferase family 39 protein [Planctomycetota bacterium]
MSAGWPALLAGCFWLLVVEVAVAAVNYLRIKAQVDVGHMAVLGAGHAVGVIVLLGLARYSGWRRRLASLARPFESARGLALLLLVGAALRLVWIVAVPTPTYSDGAVYDLLARRLLETGVYDTGESRAYWPPGYPFWLAGVYAVFGASTLVAKIAGLCLAGLSEALCWVWVRRYAGPRAAAVAVLLLVCWPGRTLHLDLLSYEDLVIAATMLSLVLMPDVRHSAGGWWRWIAAGLALGVACFARSTLALLVPAVAVWLILQGVAWRRVLAVSVVYTLAMFAVLTPWMVRNYQVFDAFVPLTTNAGANLYHSVAPGSDGGFYAPAERAIRAAAGHRSDDELVRNAVGLGLAFETIRDDPGRAVYRTLVQKPALYLGSHNVVASLEAYRSIWPEAPNLARAVKAGGLLACNAYYVVLMLCPLLLVRRVTTRLRQQPAAALCLMIFLSGFVVHSVFQAQARYHLVYLPYWAMCLAMLWAGVQASSAAVASPAGHCSGR